MHTLGFVSDIIDCLMYPCSSSSPPKKITVGVLAVALIGKGIRASVWLLREAQNEFEMSRGLVGRSGEGRVGCDRGRVEW